ncbi:hypothetical protein [Cuspidothrix issatschenkoi]|uniref:Uncharacterized protein n=1 Tax=Cuspidothrix issatschenkoi CHARLIE-1 TaxID=2052836 RepID=A0A2S6CP96_9CYAN|nr:hypothetical protein [Cuspidothrix issatschenkoi]PPJ61574.1 hypothetical protein CUN59_20265 [Cuspidothrix issatschenkoi CHARLIE-1]
MPRKPTNQAFPGFETEEEDGAEDKNLLVNEDSPEYLKKVELIDAIRQAPDNVARKNAIADAAKALGKSTRTIKRMIEKVEQVGVATLAVGRKDKGQYRISKEWHDFIVSLHKWGNREGSRINHNQISGYLKAFSSQGEKLQEKKYDDKFKGYSQVREDLIAGKSGASQVC